MTTFDEREAGFERKFVHDAENEFAITARANKLLAQWAAGKLGLSSEATDDYIRAVIHAEFEKAGHEDVFAKVMADLSARGLGTTEAEVRAAMEAAIIEARHQIEDVV